MPTFPNFNFPNIIGIFLGFLAFIGILIILRYLSKQGYFHKRKGEKLDYLPSESVQQTPRKLDNTTNFCKACGAPIIKGDSFCSSCGQNLNI